MAARTRFDRVSEGISFDPEEKRTKEAEANATNINEIIKRHRRTGVVTHINRAVPQYGDVSDMRSLHEALNLVHQAEDEFGQLPSQVRAACGNDPVMLLELLSTEQGTELLIEAGLEGEIRRDSADQVEAAAQPSPSGEATPPAKPADPDSNPS